MAPATASDMPGTPAKHATQLERKPTLAKMPDADPNAQSESDELLSLLMGGKAPEQEAEEGEEAEQGQPAKPAETEEFDGAEVLARFGNDPNKLAKSYTQSEKRMRQLEAQNDLLKKGFTAAPAAPAGQPTAPATGKSDINPFDAKKLGDTFLDDIPKSLESLHQSMTSSMTQQLNDRTDPLLHEVIKLKLEKSFPGLIDDASYEVIRNLGRQERIDEEAGGTPITENSGQTPKPQATVKKKSGKMWKLSDLRKIMNRPDYEWNTKVQAEVETIMNEKRFIRDV